MVDAVHAADVLWVPLEAQVQVQAQELVQVLPHVACAVCVVCVPQVLRAQPARREDDGKAAWPRWAPRAWAQPGAPEAWPERARP